LQVEREVRRSVENADVPSLSVRESFFNTLSELTALNPRPATRNSQLATRKKLMEKGPGQIEWRTKPSDRFVLRWIKVHLSARITPKLVPLAWLRPWMITLSHSFAGVAAGFLFALELGWAAGLTAACAQVLDGVDGQFARITGRQSRGGAFWDSVLDRYTDAALTGGMLIYLIRLPAQIPLWLLLVLGYLAFAGSGLISYSTARAENLRIPLGPPTLASKGTRTSAVILCACGTLVWPQLPAFALVYLAVHPNLVVALRLLRAMRADEPV
jgi:phosphatidylglycerophosphate synthase